jgi:hypothetical protein
MTEYEKGSKDTYDRMMIERERAIESAKEYGRIEGQQNAYAAVRKMIEDKYGKDSNPTLVIIESFFDGNEQRPALPELLSLLNPNSDRADPFHL